MKTATYRTIRKYCIEYSNTLDINDTRLEFTIDPILNQNGKMLKNKKNKKKKGQKKKTKKILSHLYGVELVPSKLIGKFNFCGDEGACLFNCIFFSGVQNIIKTEKIVNGQLSDVIKMRIRKAFLFLNDPVFFYKKLRQEILHYSEIASMMGQVAKFRLNMFSDVDHTIFQNSLPNINFYDYTKKWDQKNIPNNVLLTFSASEKTSEKMILEKLRDGQNVAVPFEKELPDTYLGYPVISGDDDDDRSNDPRSVVIGLLVKVTLKGKEDKNKFTTHFNKKTK